MKKNKRIVALILALAMMFTFMAMSASAATTEIQPRVTLCNICGYAETTSSSELTRVTNPTYPTCSKVQGYHIHTITEKYRIMQCQHCGNSWEYGNRVVSDVCRG